MSPTKDTRPICLEGKTILVAGDSPLEDRPMKNGLLDRQHPSFNFVLEQEQKIASGLTELLAFGARDEDLNGIVDAKLVFDPSTRLGSAVIDYAIVNWLSASETRLDADTVEDCCAHIGRIAPDLIVLCATDSIWVEAAMHLNKRTAFLQVPSLEPGTVGELKNLLASVASDYTLVGYASDGDVLTSEDTPVWRFHIDHEEKKLYLPKIRKLPL